MLFTFIGQLCRDVVLEPTQATTIKAQDIGEVRAFRYPFFHHLGEGCAILARIPRPVPNEEFVNYFDTVFTRPLTHLNLLNGNGILLSAL